MGLRSRLNININISYLIVIAAAIFYWVHKSVIVKSADALTICEQVKISKSQSEEHITERFSDWQSQSQNNVAEIVHNAYEQKESSLNSQLVTALAMDLKEEQREVLAEIPKDFEFVELTENLHLLPDVVLRITNLESVSDTRNYLISLIKSLSSKEKEEAIELLSRSHRDEDKLVAIDLLSTVEDQTKPKILNRLLSESPSETLLSSLVSFSKTQDNKQIIALVSDVIEKRLFAEKDETRKLQLLSISAFPDGFREYAFSLVLRSLESDDVKHQQLGYVIAKSWVGESKEKLTNRQLQAISDSAKSVLNDTSLPVEQRLASLQLLEVMPNI